MDEQLIRLCCQEFDGYEEAMRANPWNSGDVINYRPRIGPRLSEPLDWRMRYEQLRVTRLSHSDKYGWAPLDRDDVELIATIKKLIAEEGDRVRAEVSKAPRYLLFGGGIDCEGGWADLQHSSDKLEELKPSPSLYWWHVVDTWNGKILKVGDWTEVKVSNA